MATLGPIRSINLGTRLRGWEILREEVTRHRKLPTEGHRGVSCRILILRATSALSPWAVRPSQAALHSGLSVLRLVRNPELPAVLAGPAARQVVQPHVFLLDVLVTGLQGRREPRSAGLGSGAPPLVQPCVFLHREHNHIQDLCAVTFPTLSFIQHKTRSVRNPRPTGSPQ